MNESKLKGYGKIYAINYEAGKIIAHVTNSSKCLAYANIQIAMDAPFDGIVATEEIRSLGPTESQLDEYDEEKLLIKLNMIFDHIIHQFQNKLIVVQIARGKSASETIKLLSNIFRKITESGGRYIMQRGYKRKDYVEIPDEEFVFVNIGMVARLTRICEFPAGTIFNPTKTLELDWYETKNVRYHMDDRNIMNKFIDIEHIILFGISDTMPFVTPDNYNVEWMQNLIDKSVDN